MRSSLPVSPLVRAGALVSLLVRTLLSSLLLVSPIALGLFSSSAAHAQTTGGTLTLQAAVERAMATQPALLAARARAEAAEAGASESARRMGPSVHVTEEAQYYNEAFALPFGGMSLTVRDQFTNTFTAAVAQPVLGLGHLNEDRLSRKESGAAALADAKATEASIRQGMASWFLNHFEARALEQIAASSVKELQEQLTVANARLTSGVITKADLLRVETAVANAQQQVIAARSQAMIARATVLTSLGISPTDSHIELVEPKELLAAAAGAEQPLEAALGQAEMRRPELAARAHDREAAEHAARARGWAILPEIDLEGAYARVDGQKFAPPNSAFVGVRAQWAIWEWGASYVAQRAAAAQARAAAAQSESERRQVQLDVATSLEQGAAARASVEAAVKAVQSAEEAYRVTNAQLQAGAATTTDLLEAQSALSQSRLNFTRAQYGLALAHVSLTHAVGQ